MFGLVELSLRFWVWIHTLGTLYVGLKNAETLRDAERASRRRQSALREGISSILVWLAYRLVESYIQAWFGWMPFWGVVRLGMLCRFVWERKSYNAACASISAPILTPIIATIEPYMDNVLHIATVGVAYAHFLLTLLLAKARPHIVSAFRSGLLDVLFQSAEDSYANHPPPPPPPPNALNPSAAINTVLELGRNYLPGWMGGLTDRASESSSQASRRARPNARDSLPRGEGSTSPQQSPQAYRLPAQSSPRSQTLSDARPLGRTAASALRPASIISAAPVGSRRSASTGRRGTLAHEAAMRKLSDLPSPPKGVPWAGPEKQAAHSETIGVKQEPDASISNNHGQREEEIKQDFAAPTSTVTSPSAQPTVRSASAVPTSAPSTISPVVPGGFGRTAPLYPSLASLGVPMLGESGAPSAAPPHQQFLGPVPQSFSPSIVKGAAHATHGDSRASKSPESERAGEPYIVRTPTATYTTPSQRIAARSAALSKEQEKSPREASATNDDVSPAVGHDPQGEEASDAAKHSRAAAATMPQPRKKTASSTSSRIARPKKAGKADQASLAATSASRRNLRTRSQSREASSLEESNSMRPNAKDLEADETALPDAQVARLGAATPRRKLGGKRVFIPDEDGDEDSAWEAALRLRKSSNGQKNESFGPNGGDASLGNHNVEATPKAKHGVPAFTLQAPAPSSSSPAQPAKSAAALLAPSKTVPRASGSSTLTTSDVDRETRPGQTRGTRTAGRAAKARSVDEASHSAAEPVPTRRSTRTRATPRARAALGVESEATTDSEAASSTWSSSREVTPKVAHEMTTSDEEYAERSPGSKSKAKDPQQTVGRAKTIARRGKRKAEESEEGASGVESKVETARGRNGAGPAKRGRGGAVPVQASRGSNGSLGASATLSALPRGMSKRSLALAKARQGPTSRISTGDDSSEKSASRAFSTTKTGKIKEQTAGNANMFSFGGEEEANRAELELGRLLGGKKS
ncbi:hypothetical protein CBOM_00317 [Ceraceosorus bombacis]|uniref:Uncharacterized protein n=1 Tax=Ceraceosorus bombacis TaxID=401625 RepID=A0A0P1BAU8_9BASI|nr:hypothetical protein CBOM_00317 [Ceraceosorus bombacis]